MVWCPNVKHVIDKTRYFYSSRGDRIKSQYKTLQMSLFCGIADIIKLASDFILISLLDQRGLWKLKVSYK